MNKLVNLIFILAWRKGVGTKRRRFRRDTGSTRSGPAGDSSRRPP